MYYLTAYRRTVCIPAVLLTLSVLLSSSVRAAVVSPSVAAAVYNLNGVTGWIRFFESESENQTGILVNLKGLSQEITGWSVRELPVDETIRPSDRCTQAYLGRVYDPTDVVLATQCDNASCAVGDLYGR